MRRPARAKRVVGAVHPVVQRPGQERFLALDVAEPAVAGVEQLLLVRDAVAIGVGVLPQLVGVRLLGQDDARPERRDEPREHEVVDEHGVLVVDAVVVAVDVHRDPADRVELSGHVEIEHVAAILDDEHPAVAVERDRGGLLNDRIGQHELEAIPRLQDELLELFLRRARTERRLLGPIDVGIDRIVFAAAAQPAAPCWRRLWGRRALTCCRLRRPARGCLRRQRERSGDQDKSESRGKRKRMSM